MCFSFFLLVGGGWSVSTVFGLINVVDAFVVCWFSGCSVVMVLVYFVIGVWVGWLWCSVRLFFWYGAYVLIVVNSVVHCMV